MAISASRAYELSGAGRARNIIIVDEHPLFRHGLVAALARSPEITVVGEAGNESDARRLIAEHESIDLAVVGLLPYVAGNALLASLRELSRLVRVLALSASPRQDMVAEIGRTGAFGYALKSDPGEMLIRAIQLSADGIHLERRSADARRESARRLG